MSGSLAIHVNREQPNAIEAPETFETSADFAIEVTNDGQPVHFHVNCDDDLRDGLSVEIGNHFVPRKGVYRIPVTIDDAERPFRGKCTISIGYGAVTEYVEIRVSEPTGSKQVTVDERLNQPIHRSRANPLTDRLLSDSTMLVVFLGAFGVLVIAAFVLARLTTPLAGILFLVIFVLLSIGTYLAVVGGESFDEL